MRCACFDGHSRHADPHRARVAQHLDTIAVEPLEGQVEHYVGLAVERSVLAAGLQLDRRPAPVARRDAPETIRAVPGPLTAGGATRSALALQHAPFRSCRA